MNGVRLHGFTFHSSSVSSTGSVPTHKHRECRFRVLRPLAEKRGLERWGKIVNFTTGEGFSSRLPFGKFKGGLEINLKGKIETTMGA